MWRTCPRLSIRSSGSVPASLRAASARGMAPIMSDLASSFMTKSMQAIAIGSSRPRHR